MVPKTKAQIAKCLKDKEWRMNNLYTLVDEGGEKRPYRRRETQADLAKNRHGLDVVLKSRQHGISSESDIDILDDCIFTPDLRCGIIAHTKLDAQEIFETKVKLPYFELPETIRRRIPHTKCDGCTLRLANGSSIRVAVSFRSATTHRLHISELGKICAKYPKRAREIKTGTMPSVHPQLGGKAIIEGTAEGNAGDFYELCIQAQSDTAEAKKKGILLNPKQYKFHFYSWFQDPKNVLDPKDVKISDELNRYFKDLAKDHGIKLSSEQKAWYAQTKDGAGGLGKLMKREHPSTVQEAFEQSVEGAIFGEQMEKAYEDGRVGFYPHIENLPVITFWDLGYRHATSVIFVQKYGEQKRIIDHHSERGRGATYHAGIVNDKPYQYENHYFPHDVMQHEKGSGIILLDTYQSLLKNKCEVVARPKLKEDSLESAYNVFPTVVFNVKTTVDLRKSLAFYRYEWDEDHSRFGKDPLDDWAADDADAFQLMAMKYRLETVGAVQHEDWPPSVSKSNVAVRKRAWNAPKRKRRV
jgi:hypothetical protein